MKDEELACARLESWKRALIDQGPDNPLLDLRLLRPGAATEGVAWPLAGADPCAVDAALAAGVALALLSFDSGDHGDEVGAFDHVGPAPVGPEAAHDAPVGGAPPPGDPEPVSPAPQCDGARPVRLGDVGGREPGEVPPRGALGGEAAIGHDGKYASIKPTTDHMVMLQAAVDHEGDRKGQGDVEHLIGQDDQDLVQT